MPTVRESNPMFRPFADCDQYDAERIASRLWETSREARAEFPNKGEFVGYAKAIARGVVAANFIATTPGADKPAPRPPSSAQAGLNDVPAVPPGDMDRRRRVDWGFAARVSRAYGDGLRAEDGEL